MPEKQIWSQAVSNCAQSCFHLYANYQSFPSNWIILAFLQLCNLLCFILYCFCESVILSCEFMLSKGKNFEETLRLQPWRYITILLHLHSYEIKLPFFWQILLEIKILPLISQMLAFLGTLFILTIRIFEALPQTNHSILRKTLTE